MKIVAVTMLARALPHKPNVSLPSPCLSLGAELTERQSLGRLATAHARLVTGVVAALGDLDQSLSRCGGGLIACSRGGFESRRVLGRLTPESRRICSATTRTSSKASRSAFVISDSARSRCAGLGSPAR